MNHTPHLSHDDHAQCLQVLAGAQRIRSQEDLVGWLRGDVQQLLPHDVLVTAWGDLQGGAMRVDILCHRPGQQCGTLDAQALGAAIRQSFSRWTSARQRPCAIDAAAVGPALAGPGGTQGRMRSAIAHGLRDQRTGQDCLYIMLGQACTEDGAAQEALGLLLPLLDATLRQSLLRPAHESGGVWPPAAHHSPGVAQITLPTSRPDALLDTGMTERELQIMRWVEMGKTNQEIGAILDISGFTVKNHLQRIYKKLNVFSRAQAVSWVKDHVFHG